MNGLKKHWKDEKGFTLVELLAVIVILGIVAAIAVPSIGNIIENSKKDAHIANAQSFAEAARLYDVAEDIESGLTEVSIGELQTKGYIAESITSPTEPYDLDNSKVMFGRTDGEVNVTVTLVVEGDHVLFSEEDPNTLTTDKVTLKSE